ncbi:hypothetical protein TNCV_494291 [Trichonephila clavipes]|nr:hypothetical protein TNCV_494291 [Trichonephila clavipes]
MTIVLPWWLRYSILNRKVHSSILASLMTLAVQKEPQQSWRHVSIANATMQSYTMMQPKKPSHKNDAFHKAVTYNKATYKSSHMNDATLKAVALKVTQLLTRSPQIWYQSFTYLSNHSQGSSVEVASI